MPIIRCATEGDLHARRRHPVLFQFLSKQVTANNPAIADVVSNPDIFLSYHEAMCHLFWSSSLVFISRSNPPILSISAAYRSHNTQKSYLYRPCSGVLAAGDGAAGASRVVMPQADAPPGGCVEAQTE